jgi:predicted DNA-binding transcriptional regulator YafY
VVEVDGGARAEDAYDDVPQPPGDRGHRCRIGFGAPSSRRVEPYRLVHTGRRWYLVARDTDRDDRRTFRVDRITTPRPSGIRFTPQDPPDAATVGVLETLGESSCLLTTGSNSLDAIAVHLALIGVDFTVVEPPVLIQHLREMARRLIHATSAVPD